MSASPPQPSILGFSCFPSAAARNLRNTKIHARGERRDSPPSGVRERISGGRCSTRTFPLGPLGLVPRFLFGPRRALRALSERFGMHLRPKPRSFSRRVGATSIPKLNDLQQPQEDLQEAQEAPGILEKRVLLGSVHFLKSEVSVPTHKTWLELSTGSQLWVDAIHPRTPLRGVVALPLIMAASGGPIK